MNYCSQKARVSQSDEATHIHAGCWHDNVGSVTSRFILTQLRRGEFADSAARGTESRNINWQKAQLVQR